MYGLGGAVKIIQAKGKADTSPGSFKDGCASCVTHPFMSLTQYLAALPGCQRCRPPGWQSPHRWSSRHPPAASAPCACVPHPPHAAASVGAGPCALGAAAADYSCPLGLPPGSRSATRDPPTAPEDRKGTVSGLWADTGSQAGKGTFLQSVVSSVPSEGTSVPPAGLGVRSQFCALRTAVTS